jgi:hypothetical protein
MLEYTCPGVFNCLIKKISTKKITYRNYKMKLRRTENEAKKIRKSVGKW